jgi:hypothetical protein
MRHGSSVRALKFKPSTTKKKKKKKVQIPIPPKKIKKQNKTKQTLRQYGEQCSSLPFIGEEMLRHGLKLFPRLVLGSEQGQKNLS